MIAAPLKDTLAQAAQDQEEFSFQETLAFLDSVKTKMETLGLMSWEDALSCKGESPFVKEQLQQYGLYRFDYFGGAPTFQRLAVIINAEVVETENAGELTGEGKIISLNIDSAAPSAENWRWQPRLTCAVAPVHFTLHPGHGSSLSINNHKALGKLARYDWANRSDALKAFADMLALHGSPAQPYAKRGCYSP